MPFCSTMSMASRMIGVVVEQLVGFFGDQRIVRVRHCHAPRLRLAAERLAQHVAEIDHADLRAGHAGNFEHGLPPPASRISISISLSSSSPARSLLRKLSRVVLLVLPPVSASSMRSSARASACASHIAAPALAHLRDADFDQIAHDLLHVAADIADFREFRRFDFEERRLRELGETPRNLRLADARRPDHQDVLRQHFFAQFGRRAAAGASDCAARWRRRAWRRPGRR